MLHRLLTAEGVIQEIPAGKAVCVGRNYADHAAEMNSPVPSKPMLFMKPSTAFCPVEPAFSIPIDRGEVHHELEVAILIGQPLTKASNEDVEMAISGIGLGLDLTLRERQAELKKKGHPWEESKAFDGSCPISNFVAYNPDKHGLENLSFSLEKNGVVVQSGNSRDMIFPVLDLVKAISQHFTLLPGDVVMTGTPAGVGPIEVGDTLVARLDGIISIATQVSG